MGKRDYYDVLGVSKNSTQAEIKKAYRQIAMKYHPDRNQGDSESEEKFKEASEAYSVLGNEEKKSKYDQFGFNGLNSQGQGFSDFSFFSDSIFSDFEDILGDVFGFGNRSSSGSRQNRSRRGEDIGVETSITLEESFNGIEKEVVVERETNCSECSGSGSENGTSPETCKQCGGHGSVRRSQGFFSISTPCPACRGKGSIIVHPCNMCSGTGREKKEKKIKVNIPAGVDSGNRLRISDEGDDGYMNGRAGDLYILINVEEDRNFRRVGIDLIYDMVITFSQAALGDDININAFHGKEKIKITAETQNGKIMKIRSKGFKNLNGWGKGDLLIVIKILTPTELSKKEKELFRELKKIETAKQAGSEKKNPLYN